MTIIINLNLMLLEIPSNSLLIIYVLLYIDLFHINFILILFNYLLTLQDVFIRFLLIIHLNCYLNQSLWKYFRFFIARATFLACFIFINWINQDRMGFQYTFARVWTWVIHWIFLFFGFLLCLFYLSGVCLPFSFAAALLPQQSVSRYSALIEHFRRWALE